MTSKAIFLFQKLSFREFKAALKKKLQKLVILY